MLVLSRQVGEEIVIAGSIRVKIVAIRGQQVRLGIVAPSNVRVDREEVHSRIMEFAEETNNPRSRIDRVQPDLVVG